MSNFSFTPKNNQSTRQRSGSLLNLYIFIFPGASHRNTCFILITSGHSYLAFINSEIKFFKYSPPYTVKHKRFWAYSAMKTALIVTVLYLTIVDGKFFSDCNQKVIFVILLIDV